MEQKENGDQIDPIINPITFRPLVTKEIWAKSPELVRLINSSFSELDKKRQKLTTVDDADRFVLIGKTGFSTCGLLAGRDWSEVTAGRWAVNHK